MGQKGPKMNISIPALESTIVAGNKFKQECEARAQSIRQTCMAMESDESLVGGEGDTIRELFRSIAAGINSIESSMMYAVTLELRFQRSQQAEVALGVLNFFTEVADKGIHCIAEGCYVCCDLISCSADCFGIKLHCLTH